MEGFVAWTEETTASQEKGNGPGGGRFYVHRATQSVHFFGRILVLNQGKSPGLERQFYVFGLARIVLG